MKETVYVNNNQIDISLVEKHYRFKIGWGKNALMFFLGVVGILVGVNSFFTEMAFLNYLFPILSMFLFATFAISILRSTNGTDKVLITKDNIYLPRQWSFNKYIEIPLLGINSIDLVEISGNTIFQINFQKKQYSIPNMLISSQEEFQEIVKLVSQKVRPEILKQPFDITP